MIDRPFPEADVRNEPIFLLEPPSVVQRGARLAARAVSRGRRGPREEEEASGSGGGVRSMATALAGIARRGASAAVRATRGAEGSDSGAVLQDRLSRSGDAGQAGNGAAGRAEETPEETARRLVGWRPRGQRGFLPRGRGGGKASESEGEGEDKGEDGAWGEEVAGSVAGPRARQAFYASEWAQQKWHSWQQQAGATAAHQAHEAQWKWGADPTAAWAPAPGYGAGGWDYSQLTAALPAGWSCAYDEGGYPYYIHEETGYSQWEFPAW